MVRLGWVRLDAVSYGGEIGNSLAFLMALGHHRSIRADCNIGIGLLVYDYSVARSVDSAYFAYYDWVSSTELFLPLSDVCRGATGAGD